MKNIISFSILNSLIVSILKVVNIRVFKFRVSSFEFRVTPNYSKLKTQNSKLIYCLLLAAYCTTANAQFFDTETYGSTLSDVAMSVDGDENRNLYVTGMFHQTMIVGNDTLVSNGDSDVFLAHLDSTGAPIWATSFGYISNDIGNDVMYKNGFLYVAGFFWDTLHLGNITISANQGSALFLSKWNANDGTIVWAKAINGAGIKDVIDVEVADDLSIYITGHFNQSIDFDNITHTSFNRISGFLAKYDNNGVEQWTFPFGASGDTYGKHIATDASGNVYLVGDFDGNVIVGGSNFISGANDKNGFLAKYNASGQAQWAEELSGVGDVEIADVEMANQTIFVAGHYQNSLILDGNLIQTPTIDYNIFIAKFWDSGVYQDVLNMGNSSDEYLSSLDIEANQLMVGGYFFGNNDFNGVTFGSSSLVAAGYGYLTDTTLGTGWANFIYSSGSASPDFHDAFVNDVKLSLPTIDPDLAGQSYRAIVGTFEGNLVSPYDTLSTSNGSFDWFVAFGLIGVLTDAENMIEEKLSFNIFPNPVKDLFNVGLPFEDGQLTIYNTIGQQVYQTSFNNDFLQIDVSDFDSGVYLVTVLSDGKQITRRFVKY